MAEDFEEREFPGDASDLLQGASRTTELLAAYRWGTESAGCPPKNRFCEGADVKKIEFLRHAESSANAGLPTSNPAEIPLTKSGWEAAGAAARDYGRPPPDLIVVSPFRRAQETSDPFKKRFATAAVEYWPVQEFTYLNPARCLATTSTDRLPLVEAYWRNARSDEVDGPGVESFQQFLERVQSALRKLQDRPEQAILVISHEMFIKAAMWLETLGDASPTPQAFRTFALKFAIPNLGSWSYPGGHYVPHNRQVPP